MGSDAHYFKIGLFVTVAVVLGALGVVVLGAGAIMRSTIRFETYLDESVQGLDVGAPVKFRGVQVGRVVDIGFVNGKYDTAHRYVHITLAVWQDAIVESPDEEAEEITRRVQREVAVGMRIRLASSGLGGAMYMEIDYVIDPAKAPPLPIDWSPANVYIPSILSTGTRFTEGAEKVLAHLDEADIPGIARRTSMLLDELNLLARRDLGPAVASLRRTSDELPGAVSDIRAALVDGLAAEAKLLIQETREVVTTDVARAVRSIDDSVGRAANGFDRYLVSLDQDFKSEVVPALRDIRAAASGLPKSMERLNRTLLRLDRYVVGQEDDLGEILNRIRVVTDSLAEFAELARKYPSQVIWGKEPPESRLRRDR